MFTSDQYELIDFGDGRRLERFGHRLLDRVAPAVESIVKSNPEVWKDADARFERTGPDKGKWYGSGGLSDKWIISHNEYRFELKITEFGHLGLFPEQAENWDWIAKQLEPDRGRPKVLNLFAYTGGSTLAAAKAGAEVVHVDSAKNTVRWARRNAELSGLENAPIRWIAEDAVKFVQRELNRANQYEAIILDPPSYGHGPKGEVWRLSRHLVKLLKMCADLTADRRRFVLLTCHTPWVGPGHLKELLLKTLGDGRTTARNLTIRASSGKNMAAGNVAIWTPQET